MPISGQRFSSGKVWRGEIVNQRKDGTSYTEEMTITPVTRDVGNPDNYFRRHSSKTLPSESGPRRKLYRATPDASDPPETPFLNASFGRTGTAAMWGCNRAFATDAGLNDPAEIIGKSDF